MASWSRGRFWPSAQRGPITATAGAARARGGVDLVAPFAGADAVDVVEHLLLAEGDAQPVVEPAAGAAGVVAPIADEDVVAGRMGQGVGMGRGEAAGAGQGSAGRTPAPPPRPLRRPGEGVEVAGLGRRVVDPLPQQGRAVDEVDGQAVVFVFVGKIPPQG